MCIDKIKSIIKNSDNIVFFGGAGVSTESCIPDFRSSDGIYSKKENNYSRFDILSHSFFFEHTEEFYSFYRKFLVYMNTKPNKAHIALTKIIIIN